MDSPAVLHVMSPLGGGVDRHVRDIVSQVCRRHVLWHVGERAEVVEVEGTPRFHPLDPARIAAAPESLAGWLTSLGIGIVHLHTVVRAPRERAAWAAQRLGLPLLVTLHDVLFQRPDAFEFPAPLPDGRWVAEVEPVLRSAKAVLAPSAYLAKLAGSTFPGLEVQVVPNGYAAHGAPAGTELCARDEFVAHRPARVVAVLGAIGTHKGADMLRELPARLAASGIGIVVIGYLDQQLHPGWQAVPHLYVHGPYQPQCVGDLLRVYGAELVLFPNRVPEGFSYALSEAWSSGIPVLAGPEGAIGERVARHGGGWLLPGGFGAAEVAAELRLRLAPESAAEMARVKSQLSLPDASRVPTLRAMADTLDAYYRRYGRTAGEAGAGAAAPAAIDALLAPSLDSSLFREELAALADLCDASGAHSKRARAFELEARGWIAKLEGDVSTLTQQLTAEVRERQRLAQELAAAKAMAQFAERLPPIVKRVLARLFRHA